jgi:FtsP/CotA-like multicopper oxidase with cupredoxin domain
MISRKEVLKLSGAGAFALASSRAVAAMAGARPTAAPIPPTDGGSTAALPPDLGRLTTADLRALPPLGTAAAIRRTGQKRTFVLVLGSATVQPLAGHSVQTRGVNGACPGPVLRMTEGDDVEITVVNRLAQPSTIHWHGVPVPFAMDGAAMFSQDPIKPGDTFVYRWTAPQAGTYMYHAHYNDIDQENVFGMIVVAPQDASREPRYALDVPIAINSIDWEPGRKIEAQAVLADSMLMESMGVNRRADPHPGMGDAMERMDMVEYWCFNGKTFPQTEPIRVKTGDLVRIRFANISHMSHPIHMHGHWFRWIAQDGAPLPDPRPMNTIPVDPGRTVDIDFIANNPGVWPLHCHIVSHMMDNHDVMSGLVTAIVYEGFTLPTVMQAHHS